MTEETTTETQRPPGFHEIRAFAKLMLALYGRQGVSRAMPVYFVASKLREELAELQIALNESPARHDRIAAKAADIALLAMEIAVRFGAGGTP